MVENQILLLIKVITALYFNDLAEDNNQEIYDEIQNVLKDIKVDPRATIGLGGDENIIDALRYTAEWMVYNRDGHYNRTDLMSRLSVNLQGNNDYILIAKESLDDSVPVADARKRVSGIMQELRYEKKRNKLKQFISKANARLNFSGEYIEINPFINDIRMELDDMHAGTTNEQVGLVGKVDFTNPDEIEAAMTKGVDLADAEGMLDTGLIGINEACGGTGIFRGAMVNIGALTHHYKTGLLLDFCLNIPRFNDPWMWDNTKRPLIYCITFENTIDQNIIILYCKLFELKYGKKCDASKININEAVKELNEYFQQRGYTFHMEHYDPAGFCVYDLHSVLNKAIESGYEIHALIIDYLPLIADNTFGDRKDIKIQKTYEMTRNFCYPKGITCFTGSQLSTEAQTLSREHPTTFTQRVCTGGWYMDCKSLHTKLDIEWICFIHKHIDGNTYLMFSRGKFRGPQVAACKKHFMYKFEEFGGIIPDSGGPSKVIYALPSVIDSGSPNISWDD